MLGGLEACPPGNNRCSEIKSEGIFESKNTLISRAKVSVKSRNLLSLVIYYRSLIYSLVIAYAALVVSIKLDRVLATSPHCI